MRSKGVRRLPVVTAAGALVGVVAFDDLLQVLAEQLQTLSRVVGREHTKETASRK
jgi:CBS domain-containing protein